MSPLKLVTLAWRNLWRNTRRTVLTLVAIGFGLLLAILMTSTQDRSFAEMIDRSARMGSGHVTVQHPEYANTPTLTRTVQHTDTLMAEALKDPEVERAVERISGSAMVATARNNFGAFFLAYDPAVEDELTISFLEHGVSAGEPLSAETTGNQVVLGRLLAENLGVEVGDKVVYTLIDREGEIVAAMGRVHGLARTGAESIDSALILIPIDHLRGQIGYGEHEATQVSLFLDDSRMAQPVAERLAQPLQDYGDTLTWYEIQPQLQGFIAMKVGGGQFMLAVILVLVAASIFNTIFVSVIERTREFGIQLALGFTPLQISGLVMLESAWLALVGLGLGGLVTLPLYLYLSANGIDVSGAMGDQPMEVGGVPIDTTLAIGIFPEHVALIVAIIIGSTLAAGVYPAWRAGRVEPVDAIKLV